MAQYKAYKRDIILIYIQWRSLFSLLFARELGRLHFSKFSKVRDPKIFFNNVPSRDCSGLLAETEMELRELLMPFIFPSFRLVLANVRPFLSHYCNEIIDILNAVKKSVDSNDTLIIDLNVNHLSPPHLFKL